MKNMMKKKNKYITKKKLLVSAIVICGMLLLFLSNIWQLHRMLLAWKGGTVITVTTPHIIFWAPSNLRKLCIPQETLMSHDQNDPSSDGLLFVRIPKAGSSTTAGVAARMAFAMAKKYTNTSEYDNNTTTTTTTVCKSRLTHSWSTRFLQERGTFANRSLTNSFLWTMLRDPAKRAMSAYYYFQGTTTKNTHTNRRMNPMTLLKQQSQHNHLLEWVYGKRRRQTLQHNPHPPHDKNKNNNMVITTRIIQQVLQEFNFIGLLERLDESLVLLQLLLQLQPQDVLYMNAKQSGTYDSIRHGCQTTPVNTISPQVQSYLSSPQWYSENTGDYMLYDAVNRSIDATIEQVFGKSKFQKALQTFQSVKALANANCHYKSPCIAQGVYRPKGEPKSKCYHEDWTCGYECLDDLFGQS